MIKMKAIAIATVIVCAVLCVLGVLAAFKLYAIANGTWDPVRDDGMAIEDVPAMLTRLKYFASSIVLSFAVLCLAASRLNRKPRAP
jgi:ABC-type Fe3+ transport system permease subunit